MILDEMTYGIILNRKEKTSKDQVRGPSMSGSWGNDENPARETEKGRPETQEKVTFQKAGEDDSLSGRREQSLCPLLSENQEIRKENVQ